MNKLFILCFAILSCTNENVKPLPCYDTYKYYKDFDFYTISGINSIDECDLSFPYIAVYQNESMLKLKLYYSAFDSSSVIFYKVDNYWESPVDSIKEIRMQYLKHFLYDQKKYILEYHFENKKKILDAIHIHSISQDLSIIEGYIFSKNKKVYKELPWKIDTSKYYRREHSIENINDNVLERINSYRTLNGELNKSKHCYFIGNYPEIFLNYFPWKFKIVDCGSE